MPLAEITGGDLVWILLVVLIVLVIVALVRPRL